MSGRVAVVAVSAALLATSSAGAADAGMHKVVKCDPYTGVCVVTVVEDGQPPINPGPNPSPSPEPDDPCAGMVGGDPATAIDPAACRSELHSEQCLQDEADALNAADTAAQAAGQPLPATLADLSEAQFAVLNAQLQKDGCKQVLTPGTEAQDALKKIVFPLPSGHRSPLETSLIHGMPYTYTGLWTFFWTDQSTWKTLTATAATPDGSVWATVTAKPVSLNFDPGDGSSPVVCDGPGRPWVDADGFTAPSGGACGYMYTKLSTAPVTATETETWQVTWVGSGGSSGTITPPMPTKTSGKLNVLQIETVVTR